MASLSTAISLIWNCKFESVEIREGLRVQQLVAKRSTRVKVHFIWTSELQLDGGPTRRRSPVQFQIVSSPKMIPFSMRFIIESGFKLVDWSAVDWIIQRWKRSKIDQKSIEIAWSISDTKFKGRHQNWATILHFIPNKSTLNIDRNIINNNE